MAAEEDLPKELDKLQIASVPQFQLSKDAPIGMNPFSDSELKIAPTASDMVEISVLRYSLLNGCGCRLRRSSESVLDELKATKGVQVPKKSITTQAGSRRTILREPVLKALHFHSQGRARRRYFSSGSSGNSPNQCIEHHNSHTNGALKSGISDFGELITECCNISGDDDADGSSNQKSLDNRISKNFTTMQPSAKTNKLPRIRSSVRIYNRSRPKHVCYRNWSTTNSLREHLQNCTNVPLPKSTASDPEISTNARHGNSCSQQAAGNSATAICDDITINELASYFDTLVHIPKKMSPMAEMIKPIDAKSILCDI
uniref:Oxidative stress-responsive serine-rich protein 1 n=1 Tax=Glossina austeni TaxID=7395 RepID=A0A1A9V2C4_GLOAU